ncbi:CREB-binding protein [Trichinella zimbabwensis]|uniref:histone acetyltransferase n=1 Tax=Trichinella zimbabwensis TaxID=268475 RepID=A0A0V1H5J5_9BILA|nr:CREB-binding protein [Trichinella zimbabwensis]
MTLYNGVSLNEQTKSVKWISTVLSLSKIRSDFEHIANTTLDLKDMVENAVIFKKLNKFKKTERFETWKLIIWQLILLLHARKCPHELANFNTLKAQCILVQCRHAKRIWKHLEYCSDQSYCNELYCSSSKKLLFHWNNCKNDNCDICAAVKKTNVNQSLTSSSNNSSEQDASKQSTILTVLSESTHLSLAESESLLSNINDDSTSPAAVCENSEQNQVNFCTIENNLYNKKYDSPWQFCEDMWQLFEKISTHYYRTSRLNHYCNTLQQYFAVKMDAVMRMLGYCCCRSFSYTIIPLPCRGNPTCLIRRNAYYYFYQKIVEVDGKCNAVKYIYCRKCFKEISEDIIIDENSDASEKIRKEKFVMLKNNQTVYETFVTCNICSKKWHRICALHHDGIHPEGFICEKCLIKRNITLPMNKFTAKLLPQDKMSVHIENRVNKLLRDNKADGKEVIIRVLSDCNAEAEVKPFMKAEFCDADLMSYKFPYRSKAIFAFQIIDNKEICFFGMFVQEYGSSCPPPNSRQIYIAYLDSVKYFEPQNLRTAVYQEILLGYMQYVKSLGFMKVNIWACPSNRNNEYIFYCHPLEQKIPNGKMLQEWYKCLLDKGIMENIIVDYKEIYKHIQDSRFTSVTELPYFEGDWLPEMLESLIIKLKEDIQKSKTDASMTDGPILAHTIQNNEQRVNITVSQDFISGKELFENALLHIKKHREAYFVAILYTDNVASFLKPINDADQLISCKLMSSRNQFFSMAKEFKWEFSSLRRTKFSTMAICYRLHNCDKEPIAICIKCRTDYASWHCTLCEMMKAQKCTVPESLSAGQGGLFSLGLTDRDTLETTGSNIL